MPEWSCSIIAVGDVTVTVVERNSSVISDISPKVVFLPRVAMTFAVSVSSREFAFFYEIEYYKVSILANSQQTAER